MTAQIAYWIALGALVLIITFRGSGPMKRTVYSLLAVGLASFALAEQTLFPSLMWPTEGYSLAMMTIDGLAATIILIHPAGKVQSLIGLTFLLQIGVHAGRLFNGSNADMNSFWWGLTLLAILQLVLIGGWWVNEQLDGHRAVRRAGPLAAPSHRKGVG